MDATEPVLPRERMVGVRVAVVVAVAAGFLVLGSFLPWVAVRFDGVAISELSGTGWSRGDGKITVLLGVGALIVAALLAMGRSDRWITIGLGVGAIVGVVDVVLDLLEATGSDASGDIASGLGLQPDGIASTFGNGLIVTGIGAIGLAMAAAMLELERR